MNQEVFKKISKKQVCILDGGMGTQLQQRDMDENINPVLFNFSHPEIICEIHREYVQAGAQIVLANTFQANALKLKGSFKTPASCIQAAVALAKQASSPLVALDVGPLGALLAPGGQLQFEQAYDLFAEQMIAGQAAGCDLIFIETIADLYEMKAAVLAAKEKTSLPVFASMTFENDKRTFTGTSPQAAAVTLESLGVDAIGANCSCGPDQLIDVIEQMAGASKIPILAKPNAGLPAFKNGRTYYPLSPTDFQEQMRRLYQAGASILGGCCGTTPAHIAALAKGFGGKVAQRRKREDVFAASFAQCTPIGKQFCIVGERINPTGRPLLKEALLKNRWNPILQEAILQERADADLLDVNVGVPGIKEDKKMKEAVRQVQAVTTTPLCIDSADYRALESGARAYNGRVFLNSVDASDEKLERVLPIAAKYGALLVGLTLTEKGIPNDVKQSVCLAEKIVKRAQAHGIAPENLLIDPLTLPVSAQPQKARETLEALSFIKRHLGCHTILGVSNISFGLPQREALNAAFLSAAYGAGLKTAIVNPLSTKMKESIDSIRVLDGVDVNAKKYIAQYAEIQEKEKEQNMEEDSLYDAIVTGRTEVMKTLTEQALQQEDPLLLIETCFVRALDEVGEKYEKGTLFLPQLLQSAEAAKEGLRVIRQRLKSSEVGNKGKVIIATVQGDIHDIGKNIAGFLMENYGFDVIDLGKDVSAQLVLEAIRREGACLVGLSALMTTTLKSMEKTVSLIREEFDCKIMLGGAVVNKEYVESVGADFYVKDAQESVKAAQTVYGAISE